MSFVRTLMPPRVLTQGRAIYCFVINQLATPGLGSILGRRFVAGAGQLVLSVSGFLLLVIWMFHYFFRVAMEQLDEPAPRSSHAAMAGWGVALFGAAWLWALVTSISLLCEAKRLEQAAAANVPPRIAEAPPSKPDASS